MGRNNQRLPYHVSFLEGSISINFSQSWFLFEGNAHKDAYRCCKYSNPKYDGNFSITCFAFVACVNWPRFEFTRLLQRIHKTSKTIASMTAWDRFLCMNVCVFTANQDSGGIYGHHLFFVPLGSRAILCKSSRKNYLKLRSFFAYEVLNDLMR